METIFYISLAAAMIARIVAFMTTGGTHELFTWIAGVAAFVCFVSLMILLGRWILWELIYESWVQAEHCLMSNPESLSETGKAICAGLK